MFTVAEIARATGGEIVGALSGDVAGVSIDSRMVKSNELFVSLRGERFDGHDFIGAAVSRGVRVFLAEKEWIIRHGVPAGASCVAVTDTLRGLGDLAGFHRGRFVLPMVAVTGSNGKTTTKEMIAAILATTGPGLKTGGNLNNLVGLPLTLLTLLPAGSVGGPGDGYERTGRDRPACRDRPAGRGGDHQRLSRPPGEHGKRRGRGPGEGELFLRLSAGGWAVYNADDPLIAACPSPHGVLRLGFGLKAGEVGATGIRTEGRHGIHFTLRLPGGEIPVRMKAYGLHNVANALAAAAAATALGLGTEAIRQGWKRSPRMKSVSTWRRSAGSS